MNLEERITKLEDLLSELIHRLNNHEKIVNDRRVTPNDLLEDFNCNLNNTNMESRKYTNRVSDKILMGVNEAGKLANVSAQLVREWCAHHVIPYCRNGNRFLIRVDTLDIFLEINEGKDLTQFDTLINPGMIRKSHISCNGP